MKNGYNGFTRRMRRRAHQWLNKQNRPKPLYCMACGQREGILLLHTEDYSPPFGEHIGKYKLCYSCHNLLLLRLTLPENFRDYKNKIANGCIYLPITGGWGEFKRLFCSGPITASFYKLETREHDPQLLNRLEKESEKIYRERKLYGAIKR